MITIKELEERLKMSYTKDDKQNTETKRKYNIDNTIELYKSETLNENLVNVDEGVGKEERIYLYKTSKGEKIFVQIPGKESKRDGDKAFPYDARPCIMTRDGHIIKNLAFKDMWHIAEDINDRHRNIMNCLGALFFHDGRMTKHKLVNEPLEAEIIEKTVKKPGKSPIVDETVIHNKEVNLSWYKLILDSDVIESLNYNVAEVDIQDEVYTLSFEAFLYFFDMILQNEDNKYYFKKKDLTSGRISTSDSMLLLNSFFLGNTKVSSLLQRYVSGFGIGRCNKDELEPATGNLIKQIK